MFSYHYPQWTLLIFCSFRKFIAKFGSQYDFSKHEISCEPRHRSSLKQPSLAEIPVHDNVAEIISRQGDPIFAKEHAATDEVPSSRWTFQKSWARCIVRNIENTTSKIKFAFTIWSVAIVKDYESVKLIHRSIAFHF